MSAKSSQLHLSGNLGGDHARCMRQRTISVKEVAHRLGVSRSTVYRVDRSEGSFRFALEGRRIFIDAASFEAHLVNARGYQPIEDPETARTLPNAGQPLEDPEAQPQTLVPVAKPLV